MENFLDNLVVSATFILLMLSILLIYSLMIGDVEEKTYEFGMLRALGFKKSWLIILLTVEAIIFASILNNNNISSWTGFRIIIFIFIEFHSCHDDLQFYRISFIISAGYICNHFRGMHRHSGSLD